MRNKQIDLDNHLFAALERLGDEDLGPDEVKLEIERAKAIGGVAAQINSSRSLTLKAAMFCEESGAGRQALPEGF